MTRLPSIESKSHRRKDKHILTLKITEGTWPEHRGVTIYETQVIVCFTDGAQQVGECRPGSTLQGLDSKTITIIQPLGN